MARALVCLVLIMYVTVLFLGSPDKAEGTFLVNLFSVNSRLDNLERQVAQLWWASQANNNNNNANMRPAQQAGTR